MLGSPLVTQSWLGDAHGGLGIAATTKSNQPRILSHVLSTSSEKGILVGTASALEADSKFKCGMRGMSS